MELRVQSAARPGRRRSPGPRAPPAESQLGNRAPGPLQLPRALSITFVRVNDRDLAGKLDLYFDPDLGYRVETLFRGAFLNDSTLGGTFVTRDERGKIVRRGKWNAARTDLSVRARP